MSIGRRVALAGWSRFHDERYDSPYFTLVSGPCSLCHQHNASALSFANISTVLFPHESNQKTRCIRRLASDHYNSHEASIIATLEGLHGISELVVRPGESLTPVVYRPRAQAAGAQFLGNDPVARVRGETIYRMLIISDEDGRALPKF